MSEAANGKIRVKAVVKWYDDIKGFGFLSAPDFPRDIFVHKSQLEKAKITLQEGDEITCVVTSGPKGHSASALAKA